MTEQGVQFELIAAAAGLLTAEEIAALVRHCDQNAGSGLLSGGLERQGYRRSRVAWARREDGFGWLYDRVWGLSMGFNEQFFGFEISGIEKAI